jgi:hypothetical protein
MAFRQRGGEVFKLLAPIAGKGRTFSILVYSGEKGGKRHLDIVESAST